MSARRYDESDVRSRPAKRGSRPRTKRRPDHKDATEGMVIAVDRGRYTVEIPHSARVTAMRARELGRTQIVVGDRVELVGDLSGNEGTLARIVRIADRRTVLRRSSDDQDSVERVVVANADQLVVVVALADPPPRPRMVDRCLVAAYDAGMDVAICGTKADLADAREFDALYAPLGVPLITVGMERRPGDEAGIGPLGPLRELLAGRVSVLLGHSGVGKSTLVNALVPAADRATGSVNETTGRGRHTSTSAIGLELPADGENAGGWIIDTPGVRSLGLAHVDVTHVIAAFSDLAEVIEDCPRGCTHEADSPDCALDEWTQLAAGPGGEETEESARRAARVDSLRRLLASRS